MKQNAYFSDGADMLQRAIAPLDFSLFILYMPILLDLAKGMSDIEGSELSRRGYLTLMDGITGEIAFTVPFGEIPDDKREKYFKFSQEKAYRLFSRLDKHLQSGHTTSYESRNVDHDQYGGAIYVDSFSCSFILSFSGMPELIDEAMMLVLADKLIQIYGLKKLKKIEACERNPYWKGLRDLFAKDQKVLFG